MFTDIATRVYNHNWKLDPIFRSMLDQDFYKFLMAQFIWKRHKTLNVTFGLKNRSSKVKLAHIIDENELRAQLDHARTIKLTRQESTWLRGNTFYGEKNIFDSDFITWLENFTLPEYNLVSVEGEYHLTFEGPWIETTFWEIPALSIINELLSRSRLKGLSRFEIDLIYSRAKVKLWDKADRLRWVYKGGRLPGFHQIQKHGKPKFTISDFGTRRRHSFLWQRWAVQAMIECIGDSFIGTSNALLAMENNLEAIGTNAHELPMVYAALSNEDEESLLNSPYEVLRDWQEMYHGNLKVVLPDTFGTTSFLNNAPPWVADWKGFRPDSKPVDDAIDEILSFWYLNKQDPKNKLIILSDGMDIDSILRAVNNHWYKTNLSIGWGTNLTNDFNGCMPDGGDSLKAISLVCKAIKVNDRNCVKLSDNPCKAMGNVEAIELYKRVFGQTGSINREVSV